MDENNKMPIVNLKEFWKELDKETKLVNCDDDSWDDEWDDSWDDNCCCCVGGFSK